jgi:transcriptional regulator with XRE-family HTH domain
VTSSGQRIRALLKKKQMTITELAKLARIDRSALTNIVNDEIPLGATRAERIAAALGVPVDQVRQSPAADAAKRRDLDRRLLAVEDEADQLRAVLHAVLEALDLEVVPGADGRGPTVRRTQPPHAGRA